MKETWEASERSNQSVVSYVVSIRERLEKMVALVRENAQQAQKAWYDLNVRQGASRRETVSRFCYQRPTTHYWLNGKGHIK